MHIIVLEDKPSSSRGGAEISMFDLSRRLSQRGHNVSLVYLQEGDLVEQYQNFCLHTIKVNSFHPKKGIINIFKFLADVLKVNKERNSIIYCNGYRYTIFGFSLAFIRGLPLICHLRLPPKYLPKPPKRQYPKLLSSFKNVNVKQFITVSNKTKLDWVNDGFRKEKIQVVYNGINPDEFKPLRSNCSAREQLNIDKNMKVIAYIGRISREKGIEILIKAFALIIKDGINAKLLIAGKPFGKTAEIYILFLKNLIADLGIEKQIVFWGHTNNPVSIYQLSDLTVVPSLWSEPFGKVVIESMACGVPALASSVGGIPEILTGKFQSLLFEPGNVQNLAQLIHQTLDWKKDRPELGIECREHIINNFDIKQTVSKVEKILLNTVGENLKTNLPLQTITKNVA